MLNVDLRICLQETRGSFHTLRWKSFLYRKARTINHPSLLDGFHDRRTTRNHCCGIVFKMDISRAEDPQFVREQRSRVPLRDSDVGTAGREGRCHQQIEPIRFRQARAIRAPQRSSSTADMKICILKKHGHPGTRPSHRTNAVGCVDAKTCRN